MRILEFIRKILFWTVDFLKGRNVRKHYNDILLINENSFSSELKLRREKHLQNILDHALTTVPFYKMQKGSISLADFPVVDKAFVRENFEQFKSKYYLNKENHKVTTSGSTGNPFHIFHDKNKRDRNTADTIYFAKKAGYEVGSRLYYLRLWDKQYGKSNFLSWVQNISMYSVDELTEKDIYRFVSQLENDRSSTKNILAYVSALHSVCKYLDARHSKPLNCKINSVIGIAEGLNDYVRNRVKKYLNVDIISRYSNSENGIIAQQNIGSKYFEINWASYYVEILDLNHDIPVKSGESGRIVITDLFNYSMPLIRYDTGDVGILDFDQNSESLVFTNIEGRKMDMFTNTNGEYISSHIIHHILQFNEIDQFQFIEEENKEYIIKLKVTRNFDYDNETSIINQYKEYFGHDANIRIEYVKDIPLLLSGKRKLVINNAIKTLDKNAKTNPKLAPNN